MIGSTVCIIILLTSLSARHSFCAEEYWLVPELQNLEVDRSDPRVKQILQFMPFALPFAKRIKIFYDTIAEERSQYVDKI